MVVAILGFGVFTPMRIAQIAPLHEAVPPKLYGGTERVVSYLTEELVALGHQVTLFASGDSVTSARLHAVWPRSLRLDPAMRDVIAPHMLMMEEVRRRAEDFDVLHFHLDYWPFSIFTRQKVPFVTTLARAARLARAEADIQRLPRRPRRVDQRRPTPRAATGRVCRHRAARDTGKEPLAAAAGHADLSGVPWPYRAGEGAGPCHPHRARLRHPAKDRR